MIVSFRHKGLRLFYETGSTKGIQAQHADKLRRVLFALDNVSSPEPLAEVVSFRLHALKAELNGFWSIRISGNWRVIFRFTQTDVELVDYLDYH